jgi:hypothetical protein
MKIEGGRGVGSTSGSKRANASAAGGFSVPVDGAAKASSAAPSSSVTALDAILALQSEEPSSQRRGRQSRRGREALDVLEKLEQALVLGHAPGALRAELERVQKGAEATGEAGLDEVLLEIDIRLAVEAAKLDRMLGRA